MPDAVQSRPAAPVAYTQKHLAEKILTSRSALEGERKQVTVLFCDLANSTALAERLGPEAMHTLLNHFFELALAEIHRYEGTINQFLDDGFMALFGAPLAHEDHARRAVLAARLQQLAEPGTILLSETTARLVLSEVCLEALRSVHVKGKTDPVTTSRVLGRLPRRSPLAGREERALSPFVGRERELTTLHELLAQVEAGQGQVVGLVGEAGVGKSRLLFEFRQRLRERRVTYLEGRCLSYGSAIPYLPMMDILRNNAGITETDGPEAIAAKVRLSLQDVGLDPAEGAPYLLQLLGVGEGTEPLAMLSPEAIKTQTFAVLRQMSLRGSQRQPLILAVEDLHWIDQTSEACFASLAESLAGVALLLLCTYRPGYRSSWLEKSYATKIVLRRLTPPDSLAVVHAVLQRALPDPLAQVILDKAEGNPFFLEELTRAVVEHGDVRSLPALPNTIQGVLAARIDRLPEDPKRLLQTASVLGREFSPRLLGVVWDRPDVLEAYLGELKRLEFLYERTEAAEPVYVFKHVLTQEVAYDSLLTSRRQALHAAAGRALESLYADRLEEVYDRLAYHYARTAESAKAIEYLTRFAEKATRGYAHAEAITALQDALVHAGARQASLASTTVQDRHILDLVLRLAHSLYFLGRFQKTLDLLLQQQTRLEHLQAPVLAGPYYFWLSHTYSYMGDQERAAQSAQHAIAEAARCGDDATMGKAHYVLAHEGYWSGQFLHGLEHGQQAVSLLKRTQEEWWLGQSHWVVGLNYYFMGEFAQSLAATDWTDAIGETLGDPRLQSYAAWTTGMIEATRGEWQAGLEACQHSLECAPDPLNTGVTLGFMGYAYLEKGDSTAAVAALEQAVQHMRQFRFRQLYYNEDSKCGVMLPINYACKEGKMPPLIETTPRMDLAMQDITHLVEELRAYHAIYSPLFQRREQREAAHTSLQGLLATLPRKSIEPMVLAVDGVAPKAVRAMQSFISEGQWNDERLLQQHWKEVEVDLGAAEGVLMVDGSDVPKQGSHSVGVKRQYCGELGKRANCQAGVCVGSGSSQGYTVLDRRLYVPTEWLTDEAYAARRTQCGLPPDLTFKTKPELAQEMLAAVVQSQALRCRWVVADEAFGGNPAFLEGVAGLGLWYCAEVPHSTRVWEARPATHVPPWRGRGRRPQRERLVEGAPAARTVLEVAAVLPAEAWARQTIKEGSQGPMVAECATLRVGAVRETLPGPDVWLVLRRHLETGELKTSLCNAPVDTAVETHVRMSGMRWPIDTCCEDSKQLLGMGEYEVRSWTGWHHHMTLVILAHFFVVRMSLRLKKKPPR